MGGGHSNYFILQQKHTDVHTPLGMTYKHDLTLYFAECPHSERVAQDVMADLYPAFVLLLLPLCHLLRYRRLGSLGAVGGLVCCLPACGEHGGAGQGRTTDDGQVLL